jgi:hypothetical protein
MERNSCCCPVSLYTAVAFSNVAVTSHVSSNENQVVTGNLVSDDVS